VPVTEPLLLVSPWVPCCLGTVATGGGGGRHLLALGVTGSGSWHVVGALAQ
jgi:hypothetical protein